MRVRRCSSRSRSCASRIRAEDRWTSRARSRSGRSSSRRSSDRALGALKELEFDHRTGKISDEDYRELIGPLRLRVAEALRALDDGAADVRSRPGRRFVEREVPDAMARRASCQACGAKLPAKSKFCPECGTAVASGDTVVQEIPPTEDGPTPVQPHVSERRYFGVPPARFLLGLGVVGMIGAIALFATGLWPWGLIVLGVSLFLVTGFISAERHGPG